MRREGHVSKPFIRQLLTWRHLELGEWTIDIRRLPKDVQTVWREVHVPLEPRNMSFTSPLVVQGPRLPFARQVGDRPNGKGKEVVCLILQTWLRDQGVGAVTVEEEEACRRRLTRLRSRTLSVDSSGRCGART